MENFIFYAVLDLPCFLVTWNISFAGFSRVTFLQNTSGQLLLSKPLFMKRRETKDNLHAIVARFSLENHPLSSKQKQAIFEI